MGEAGTIQNGNWRVEAAYPMPNEPDEIIYVDEWLEAIAGDASAYGGSGSSWAGKGYRDLGWIIDNADVAMEIHRRMQRAPVDGLRVRVQHRPTSGDEKGGAENEV